MFVTTSLRGSASEDRWRALVGAAIPPTEQRVGARPFSDHLEAMTMFLSLTLELCCPTLLATSGDGSCQLETEHDRCENQHDTAHSGLSIRLVPSSSTRIYDAIGRCPHSFSHKPVLINRISARLYSVICAAADGYRQRSNESTHPQSRG